MHFVPLRGGRSFLVVRENRFQMRTTHAYLYNLPSTCDDLVFLLALALHKRNYQMKNKNLKKLGRQATLSVLLKTGDVSRIQAGRRFESEA